MTVAGPLVFPGSRVLAGWWQLLAPFQPQALWVAHLLLHRVEALACVSRPRSLDRFARLVLQALTLGHERTLPALEDRLHLGRQTLYQVLRRLQQEGLVQPGPSGEWQPTGLGRHALERDEYPAVGHERRRFYFVHSSAAGRKPHFLDLPDAISAPCVAPDDWAFDVGILQACVRQPAEWKRRWGFPLDVEEVHTIPRVGPPADALEGGPDPNAGAAADEPAAALGLPFPTPIPEPPAWQRVIVDWPEHLLSALVLVAPGSGGERLLGFAAHTEGWVLQAERPAFRLGEDWAEVFPELTEESPEIWQQAWRAWCQQRKLPLAEVEACTLQRHGHRLRVGAGKRLIDRLQAVRSQALRGEVWLLAGSGRIRPAAQLELVSLTP
ncbi:MAG TPA: hypothetical protein VNK04_25975 [Gemmataceae bacterium]|nr:hypothetical protein [Gemmataceae bacterium]